MIKNKICREWFWRKEDLNRFLDEHTEVKEQIISICLDNTNSIILFYWA